MKTKMIKFTVVVLGALVVLECPVPSYASPMSIRDEIIGNLNQIENLGRHEFDVDVRGTVVTLDGFVSSSSDKVRVETIARQAHGVSEVVDKLAVNGPSAVVQNEAAKRIRDSVKARSHLKGYQMEINQIENEIVISGAVSTSADKLEIGSIASGLAEGRAVSNLLVVQGAKEVPDNVLREKIASALKNEGVPGLNTVDFTVSNGIASFTGEVQGHRDIDRILSIALMIDGVRSVRSDVKIVKSAT